MLTRSDHELALVEKARQYMPAGGIGNTSAEIILRSGQGSRVWDESGNEYIDYLIGSGPMFAGHAHPRVTAAVREQVEHGSTFFANNRYAIELAEAIVDAVPCAEQVRFVSTGTEADTYAMRLARSWRGRDKILKFEGGYHGMSDTSLQSLAPKRPGNFPPPGSRLRGDPGRSGRRGPRRALQRPRRGGGPHPGTRRRDRGAHRRARPAHHPARRGIPRGTPRADREARHRASSSTRW